MNQSSNQSSSKKIGRSALPLIVLVVLAAILFWPLQQNLFSQPGAPPGTDKKPGVSGKTDPSTPSSPDNNRKEGKESKKEEGPSRPGGQALPFWKITTPAGKTSWILADVLPTDKKGLPGAILKAFRESGVLILETEDQSSPAFQKDLKEAGTIKSPEVNKTGSPDKTQVKKLPELLSPATAKFLEEQLKAEQVPPRAMEVLKPWMAALSLRKLQMQKRNLAGETRYSEFLRKQGAKQKKISLSLESRIHYLDNLQKLTDRSQELMLKDTLYSLGSLKTDLEKIYKTWRSGDQKSLQAALYARLTAHKDLAPYYSEVVYKRNTRLGEILIQKLNEAQIQFIVLDGTTLLGPRGVLALLGSKGFKIEQQLISTGGDETPVDTVSSCVKTYISNKELTMRGRWEVYLERPRGKKGHTNRWRTYNEVSKQKRWRKIKMPARWEDVPTLVSYLKNNQEGYVWYRCNVVLRGEAPRNAGLYMSMIEEADEVYFNGQLVGRTGLSPSGVVEADVEKKRLYPLPADLWKPGANLIVVRVFGSRGNAGIAAAPRIVNESSKAREIFLADVPAIIFSWTYILVAAFFLLFWLFFRHQLENLYFALFSAFLGIYHLIRTVMRYEYFDSFALSYKVELLLLICMPVLFLLFLLNLIKQKIPMPVKIFMGYYTLLAISCLMVANPREWDMVINANLAGLVVCLIILFWLIKTNYARHGDKLKYLLLGLIPVMPALINDMLVTLKIIDMPRFMVFAFLLFLGSVALQLANSVLELYRNLQAQEEELRLLEKKKTNSIFNISTEFRIIFDGIKEALSSSNGKSKTAARKKKGIIAGVNQGELTRSVTRLQNFLNDSNLLPILESGDYAVRRVRFSLRKLCDEVLNKAFQTTSESSIRLSADLPEDEVEVNGDPDLIGTVLFHLVENALLYTRGQVDVSVEKGRDHLAIFVRDEGPGLDPTQQNQVFQKFVRGVDERSEIPGIGVGLTIVKQIAETLDGEIRLESGGGYFSTFNFSIPLQVEQIRNV